MKPVPMERRGDYISTMYELEEDVCRRLLLRCGFGRVAFSDEDGPAVLPVNAMFSGDSVLFRTAPGSVLDRNVNGSTVAFEIDHTDPVAESGWSVLVRGMGARVTDSERIASLADTEIHPWAPSGRDRWIEIRAEHITGRIIRRQRLVSDDERRPYISPD